MPVDDAGNRADIVMDGNANVSRMKLASEYELFINASNRDVLKRLVQMLDIDVSNKYINIQIQDIFYTAKNKFNVAYDYLMGFYKILSPKQYDIYQNKATDEQKMFHLSMLISEFIHKGYLAHIFMPPNNEPRLIDDIYVGLRDHYPSTFSPVTYIGYSGQKVRTKENIRIGSVYMMLLEKIGGDWSSVSSARLHHFGFLAPVNKFDKSSSPFRMQPVRALGEAEVRIVISYCGQTATAELLDRNGSPETHKQICKSILTAPKPTNIDSCVDRKIVPFGGNKSLQLLKHILFVSGIEFKYRDNYQKFTNFGKIMTK